MEDQWIALLLDLGRRPTAPLYETAIIQAVQAFLTAHTIPFAADPYGNLIVRLGPAEGTPLALVAHLDHPGLEVTASQGTTALARPLGGVPLASLRPPEPVLILTDGQPVPATVVALEQTGEGPLLRLQTEGPVPTPTGAVFALPGPERRGDLLVMPAVDDLVGCAALLLTLAAVRDQALPRPLYGVFTRAEEIGLVGATLVARSGLLPPETLVVSLEASRTLPGAVIGRGPVIRVGDRSRTFDATAEGLLSAAARRLEGAPVQRQLMSGGTCEATAFGLCGYRTTGLAFPLGNYHNAGPDGRLRPEFIHVRDFLTGVRLLQTAALLDEPDPEAPLRERLATAVGRYAERLQATARRG